MSGTMPAVRPPDVRPAAPEPGADDPKPLVDPFLHRAAPLPRAQLSMLALTSVLSIFIGPVGAISAIVFGWAARREIARSGSRKTGFGLATLGLALGVVATVGWGAGLSLVIFRHRHDPAPSRPVSFLVTPPSLPKAEPTPPAPVQSPPGGSVPKQTRVRAEGDITVVDIGIDAITLEKELAKQRAAASTAGQKVLVMTTRDDCAPCRGVESSLSSALMQTALANVRLVRVDLDVFKDDLDALKMPRERYPAFFLLSVDLTPKDGIDGGEWDEDVASNIAPVIGAFLRGKYATRRQAWRPLPGSGVQL
jgi:hypothetical protein